MDLLAERTFQEKVYKYIQEINTFLKERGKEVSAKDKRISIINVQSAQCFRLDNEDLVKLFAIFEDARINNVKMNYSEYQRNPSAICIDLIFKHVVNDFIKLSSLPLLCNAICKYIKNRLNELGYAESLPENFEIRFSRRSNVTPADKINLYQEWYRFIIPNIHVSKKFKTDLYNHILSNAVLESVFARELGKVKNFAKIIESIEMRDVSIVSPVNILNNGEYPFLHHSAYQYNTWSDIVSGINIEGNVCLEHSILIAPNAIKLVTKEEEEEEYDDGQFNVAREDLEIKIRQLNEEKIQSDILLYKNVLDILDDYRNDRDKWEMVIEALARASVLQPVAPNETDPHRLLAQWFSLGCEFEDELDYFWDIVKDKQRGFSKRKLLSLARDKNYDKYKKSLDDLIINKLYFYATQYNGRIENGMIATLVYLMLCDKYIVDIGEAIKGQDYCWYEFVMPNVSMKKGEIYKWRKELEPDQIYLFIRYELVNIYKNVTKLLMEKRDELESATAVKRLNKTIACFESYAPKLYIHSYVAGIIKSSTYNFRVRGFTDSLDTCGEVMGVGNGVLLLKKTDKEDKQEVPRLITGFHDYEVSKFTTIDYEPVDWEDDYVKLMMKALQDIFQEPDVFNWIMCFVASSLDGLTKAAMILFLYGVGSNGKSFFLELVKSTLGDDYAKKFSLSLLTEPREASEKPNSAFMSLKNARFGYYSEPNKLETINTGRLKEMLGQETQSGRDLHKKQENFRIVANQVAASNWPLVIDCSDHGTWRRIRYYTCKTKFVKPEDVKHKHERPVNKDFIEKYKDDPRCQRAFLSILVHYYKKFQEEYDGDVDKIPCPTINAETEEYRNSQDTVNQFISKYLEAVDKKESEKLIQLSDVALTYTEWITNLNSNNKKQSQMSVRDAIAQLENSRLNPHIMRRAGTLFLRGYILLSHDDAKAKENMRVEMERDGTHDGDNDCSSNSH